MLKNRNILIGSLLLLVVAGTILVLSNMKYGVAKSLPIPQQPPVEARNDPSLNPIDAVNGSAPQEDIQASLEQEWEKFATTQFCFLGDDEYRPGQTDGEEPFPYGWLPSAKRNMDGAIAFLLERIPSQKRTKAHVCPFDDATEGELAVYSLQHILKKNWYELNDEYKTLHANKPEGAEIYDQDLLRGIIQNKKKVHEMIDEWKKLYEESRASVHQNVERSAAPNNSFNRSAG
ncbi:MAG TPA: hypothetical protein VM095_02695 [Pyrinomonadaceae bacterium]|nr:hypothetical protein [Pyrinomonadaceae bacterium]